MSHTAGLWLTQTASCGVHLRLTVLNTFVIENIKGRFDHRPFDRISPTFTVSHRSGPLFPITQQWLRYLIILEEALAGLFGQLSCLRSL